MVVRLIFTSLVLGGLGAFGLVVLMNEYMTPTLLPPLFFVLMGAIALGWYHKNIIAKTLGRKYAGLTQ